MNISMQSNNFNSQYQYRNGSRQNVRLNNRMSYNQPSFKGIEEIPAKSKLLAPLNRAFDKFTTFISDNYTTWLYTSKLAEFLSKHTEKLDGVVDHMQVAGSVIISGMYMTQTLNNKSLDEDRRRTLAVNQGLTFLLSTVGSYVIDRKLDNWWEGVTLRYAEKQTGDATLGSKIKGMNSKIIQDAEAAFGKSWKDIPKKQKPALVSTLKYVEDNLANTGLETKLKGMGVLKKLLIFGSVYRFLSPVAVTPVATWIGNKLSAKKEVAAAQPQNTLKANA